MTQPAVFELYNFSVFGSLRTKNTFRSGLITIFLSSFLSVAFNDHDEESKDEHSGDDLRSKQRSAIERTNARMDTFRSLQNRFDTSAPGRRSFNYSAFMIQLFKEIEQDKECSGLQCVNLASHNQNCVRFSSSKVLTFA
ncbi:MAG: hypothetical protein Q8904_01320 [Bacteroidota bacterium]|nr:hypothetical protein [Bacteroidota bacterium]